MSQFDEIDLQAGLVVFVLPSIASTDERTETNAKQTTHGDQSVRKGHLFVMIELLVDGRWLMAPIFLLRENAARDKDRYYLDESKKEGYPFAWIGEQSYIFKLQHWKLSIHTILNAAFRDNSPVGFRRFYARQDQVELRYLAKLAADNPTPFHQPNPILLKKN